MISKYLAIAAALAFLTAGTAGQAFAQQNNNPPPPAAAAPAQPGPGNAATLPGPGPAPASDNAAPGTPNGAAATGSTNSAPAINPPAAGASGVGGSSPYGLFALWRNGDFVIRAVIILLAIMSAGTWYIFFTKWLEQQRVLSQAAQVEKKFWTSATLNEGVDKLPKNSVFRGIAEAGLKASPAAPPWWA